MYSHICQSNLCCVFAEYKDNLYHYWNPHDDKFYSTNISNLFRSDYTDFEYPAPPPTTLYTCIKLWVAFLIFGVAYFLYGILLTIIKYNINKDFKAATRSEKFQHIIEALNMPEAYGDWDTDPDLDLDGHLKKWKRVLLEMFLMVLLQFVTNLCLLVPLFITG